LCNDNATFCLTYYTPFHVYNIGVVLDYYVLIILGVVESRHELPSFLYPRAKSSGTKVMSRYNPCDNPCDDTFQEPYREVIFTGK
jgi:hypothetical protein